MGVVVGRLNTGHNLIPCLAVIIPQAPCMYRLYIYVVFFYYHHTWVMLHSPFRLTQLLSPLFLPLPQPLHPTWIHHLRHRFRLHLSTRNPWLPPLTAAHTLFYISSIASGSKIQELTFAPLVVSPSSGSAGPFHLSWPPSPHLGPLINVAPFLNEVFH